MAYGLVLNSVFMLYACCAEIASSSPPAEPAGQQFAKRPPEGERLIKPTAEVLEFI